LELLEIRRAGHRLHRNNQQLHRTIGADVNSKKINEPELQQQQMEQYMELIEK